MNKVLIYRVLLHVVFIATVIFINYDKNIQNRGQIAVYSVNLKLFKEVMLELKVPNDITDKIYEIEWTVRPSTNCNIEYKKNENTPNVKYKLDRKAVITPLKKGKFIITAYCKNMDMEKIKIASKEFNAE